MFYFFMFPEKSTSMYDQQIEHIEKTHLFYIARFLLIDSPTKPWTLLTAPA